MKSKIISFAAIVLVVLLASAWAADVTGKWIAPVPGDQGNVDITLNFIVDGTVLSGTVDNPQAGPADIKDGKIDGNDISFHLVRKFGENEMKIVWKGKLSGEEIRFTREVAGGMPGGAGGAGGGGAAPTPEIIAKRAK
jgi:hypothetical protein